MQRNHTKRHGTTPFCARQWLPLLLAGGLLLCTICLGGCRVDTKGQYEVGGSYQRS